MSTTTIRLPEDIKERRNDFHKTAERRYAELVASDKTIPWSDMRKYLEDRLAGRETTRPTPRKLR